MQKLATVRRAWGFLSPLPTFWRLHQLGRILLVPFDQLLNYLPERGVVLDLGCGHGLFLALTKREKPQLQVIGIDLSAEKIAGAYHVFKATNTAVQRLAVADIADFPHETVDAISIIDVLYLVPIEKWDRILSNCYRCLKSGGTLLLKEMDRTITWKFALLYFEEIFAVKILGLTLGKQFTFPRPEEIRRRMEAAGFTVQEIPLHAGYFVPHQLWLGTK